MGFNKIKQRYTINFNFFVKTYLRSTCSPDLVQVLVHGCKGGIESVLFFKNDFTFFLLTHFFLLCKKLFISIFSLISVTFGAVTIFDQAFVSSDRMNTCFCCFLKDKNYGKGGMWQFGLEPCILVGLDSSVVEHLSIYAGVPDWTSRSSHTFPFI